MYFNSRIIHGRVVDACSVSGDLAVAGSAQKSHIVHVGKAVAQMREAEVDGKKIKFGSSWFRGEHTNFLPDKKRLAKHDAIERYVLAGLTPDKPFIDENTRITTFGSCFADNISKYLNSQHYNVLTKKDIKAYVVKHGEGMVHTYAIRQQFEWALDGRPVNSGLWHNKNREEQVADDAIRENTRDLFLNTDLFILTFGLSEVWYSKDTGDVFWHAVPEQVYDPDKHGFRVVTADENRDNIQAIYDIIRRHRPEAKIVFTLSPVPLVATFRPVQCFVANSFSKASLRVAVDEVMRANAADKNFFYWPSYEIITEFFPDPWGKDRRHPKNPILSHIMRLFEEFYCVPVAGRARLPLIQTLTPTYLPTLPMKLRTALRLGKKDVLNKEIAAAQAAGNDEFAEFLALARDGYDPNRKSAGAQKTPKEARSEVVRMKAGPQSAKVESAASDSAAAPLALSLQKMWQRVRHFGGARDSARS